MNEQIDYSFVPDKFPKAPEGFYYPKSGDLDHASDRRFYPDENNHLSIAGFIYKTVEEFNCACNAKIIRRIPATVAESKVEASPVPNARRLGEEELIQVGDKPVGRDDIPMGVAFDSYWIGKSVEFWKKGVFCDTGSVYRPNPPAQPLPATPATEDGVVVGLQPIASVFKRTGDNVFEAATRAAITRIQSDAAKIKEQGEAISTLTRERERDEARAYAIMDRFSIPAACRTNNIYHASDFYGAGKVGAI